jgi:hypothetical protein
MRLLLCILILLLSSFSASATAIIVMRSEDGSIIAIAADSLVRWSQGDHTELACKIHTTAQTVWATAGMTTEVAGKFDIGKIAEASVNNDNSLDAIASQFEESTVRQLKEAPPRIQRVNPESYANIVKSGFPVVMAVFVQRTDFRAISFNIPDSNVPDKIEVTKKDCPGNSCPAVVLGADAIQKELAKNPDVLKEKGGVIPGFNYLIDIQTKATPRDVGPPVSIFEMDKTSRWGWLENGMCRQR